MYGYPGSNDYGSSEVHWKMLSVDRQIPRHQGMPWYSTMLSLPD